MSIRSWSWKRWAVVVAAAAAIVVVGGPFVYIHFIQGKAPAPLTIGSPSADPGGPTDAGDPTGPAGTSAADGTWTVGAGSVVGYRIDETIFGQSNVAVGRTGRVTGSLTIAGTRVTSGSFTVDMRTVASDESRRDDQFNGRIMETGTFPTATFELTQPIDLDSIPGDGGQGTYHATGRLTLHGVTRAVSFPVQARRSGSTFEAVGQIPVTFADYGIENPSFGPVTTEDHGVLEFRLEFAKG